MSTNSSKVVKAVKAVKAVPNPSKTISTKTVKKSDEKVERKPNTLTNKSVKNPVKPVNTIILTTTETKKKVENISKLTTKPSSKNLSQTKTQNQPNIKSNETKLISTKNNETSRIKGTVGRNVTNTERKQTTGKKIDKVTRKQDTPIQKRQTLGTKVDKKSVEHKSLEKIVEIEDQTNKDSSDEQYVSLATLDSNSSHRKHLKSSESVLVEPPSICDTDIDADINNITDNQTNDDLPSDYCDDFEEYESDFEEDDDEDNGQQEEEPEDNIIEKEQKQVFNSYPKELPQRIENSTEKYDNQRKATIQSQKSDFNDMDDRSDVITIKTTNVKPNDCYNTLTQSVKSAKIKSEFEIKRNETIKRSEELLEIIKLNEISFTNFDLPQINYELYIKAFGRNDTKQVSCQTSEREDNETQTDFIQITDKWTQNPSFTRLVSGDENQMNENKHSLDLEPKVNPFELIQFLNKAETLMSAIIDMECDNRIIHKRSLPKGAEQFSTNVSVIKCLSLAKKCPISFTFINPLYLFCVQNVSKIDGSAEKSVISVWSLMSDKTAPVRILICRSHIVKAFSEQNLVVSAMIDGSVALWDLNQQSVCDKELNIETNKFTLRTPSFNCALTSKGHDSPIVDIKRLFDSESSDQIIHFGTFDENGIMIVWTVTEGKEETSDSPLSQTSEHRITRISMKNYLDKFDFKTGSVKITTFECQPNDWSNFYCGTDNGCVIRCTNIEESVNNLPKIYQKSYLNSIWAKVSVICFNKSEISKFLVAFTDGLLSYYSITTENPLFVFNSNEISIIDLKWIPDSSHMAFIALNNSNQILIWDLNSEQQFKPIIKYRHSNDRILSINLWKGIETFLVNILKLSYQNNINSFKFSRSLDVILDKLWFLNLAFNKLSGWSYIKVLP